MISLGLRAAQLDDLQQLLVSNHILDVTIQILDLEHNYLADVSKRLLGGQVNIDTTADTTRSLDLELLDPTHSLKLDDDAPNDGSLYFTRMIKVTYGVAASDHSRRYDIPVFCGPISKVERDEAVLSITCVGKEVLLNSAVWNSKTFKKGLSKRTAMIRILSDIGGETKYDLANTSERLPSDFSLQRGKVSPWAALKKLAAGMGYQVFYDGRGVCRMRRVPAKSVYTFGENGALLTVPQPSFDASAVINAIELIGGTPKGSKYRVGARAVAPRSHPLSPWNLGRNGAPRYLPEFINDSSVKSTSVARTRVSNRLKNAMIEAVDVAFDSLPIPFLEENDLCVVRTDGWSCEFRLNKMAIPLTADGTTSIGYLRRVYRARRVPTTAIRIKNPTKKKPKKHTSSHKKRHK